MVTRKLILFAKLTKSELIFLACAVCLSGSALLYGLNGDSPYSFENDEFSYAPISLHMAKCNDWDPAWYCNPGSTMFYPLAIYYRIVEQLTGYQLIDLRTTDFELIYRHMDVLLKWPRLATVFLVLLSLPILYLAGRNWVGKVAAMIGVTIYSLAPLVIYYGQIIRPDMWANFFIICAVYLLYYLCELPARRSLAIALGVVAGLAASTRFFCLALIAAIALTFLGALMRTKDHAQRYLIIVNGLVAATVWAVTFFLTSPFVFIHYQRALEDLKFETQSEFAGVTGLDPFSNLNFYFSEAFPECLGYVFTWGAVVGLLLKWRKPTFQTSMYTVLLLIFMIGTCCNPRHWDRWILPMLPLVCLLAGFMLDQLGLLVARLLSGKLSPKLAKISSVVVMVCVFMYAYFIPFRHLLQSEWQKTHLSPLASTYPYIKAHIPPGAKIALDAAWRWPEQYLYVLKEDIWRTDYVPPRPHNYYFPEDIAKEGYQYMIVVKWVREWYETFPTKYPRECAFFKRLHERAPLIFTSGSKDNPWILGEQTRDGTSPYEIYDLRPLAEKISESEKGH